MKLNKLKIVLLSCILFSAVSIANANENRVTSSYSWTENYSSEMLSFNDLSNNTDVSPTLTFSHNAIINSNNESIILDKDDSSWAEPLFKSSTPSTSYEHAQDKIKTKPELESVADNDPYTKSIPFETFRSKRMGMPVPSVPEPETYLMMLLGISLLSIVVRNRHRQIS